MKKIKKETLVVELKKPRNPTVAPLLFLGGGRIQKKPAKATRGPNNRAAYAEV